MSPLKDIYQKGVEFAMYGANIPDFANEKEQEDFWKGVVDTMNEGNPNNAMTIITKDNAHALLEHVCNSVIELSNMLSKKGVEEFNF